MTNDERMLKHSVVMKMPAILLQFFSALRKGRAFNSSFIAQFFCLDVSVVYTTCASLKCYPALLSEKNLTVYSYF